MERYIFQIKEERNKRTLASNWIMDILEYGTTASRTVFEAPGTDINNPKTCSKVLINHGN